MKDDIKQIALRIKELREILEISIQELAALTDMSVEEYSALENGESDFSFTFLLKISKRFGVDITDLLTGEGTRLSTYSIVRDGQGLPIERREGFSYQNMAYLFKNRLAEPYVVVAPVIEGVNDKNIHLSKHDGQEFDMVLEGEMRFILDGHFETLKKGDSVFYDSSNLHGMYSVGKECKFIAVVIPKQ